MPDEVGRCVELVGRQVGDADALGEPVHQVELRLGKGAPNRLDGRRRHRGAGVGQEAQVGQLAIGEPAQRGQHLEDRRHPGQPGDPMLLERLHHPPGEGDARLERQRRADPDAG